MARIAIVLNSSWNIYNFRLPLIEHLQRCGHEVIAVAPQDEYSDRIPCEYHAVKMRPSSLNPLHHVSLILDLRRKFSEIRPDVALLYTIQPNVHGNFAARMTGVRTVSNIAGLGNLYTRTGVVTRIASLLYKVALRHPLKVFFQNGEDMAQFLGQGLVCPSRAERIPGSGVDVQRFAPAPRGRKRKSEPFVFMLASRMLWDKGVAEFAEAAARVRKEHGDVTFRLVGPVGCETPTALDEKAMQALTAGGVVEYGGVSDRMEVTLADADCVVLPTYYREGLPRVLLEAAAMEKPLITTRAPGCSDIVEHGVNGFLVRARDSDDLYRKMIAMLEMQDEDRRRMGEAGRLKAESHFDQRFVFERYEAQIEAC